MKRSAGMRHRLPAAAAAAVAVLIIACAGTTARAAQLTARLKHDVTVGDARNIQLKTNQVVQVLNQTAGSVVVMVRLPDGSSGIYQIDSSAIEIVAAATPPPAAAASTPAPASAAVQTPAPAPPVSAAPASAAPPKYPDEFVGGPEFDTTAGKQAAGTASVVKLKGGDQSYIISARHLLGPDGGFRTQTAAKDVPRFVRSIRIESFTGRTRRYAVTGLLVPADRLDAIGGGPIDDMAVYQNRDAAPQSQALPLADEAPPIGAQVWVVAEVRGGVPQGQVMQSGKVQSNKPWIIIQFDNDQIVTNGASGAPVLNAAGEVVGVYSGHSKENGHVLGFIIPAPLIAQTIKQAALPAQ